MKRFIAGLITGILIALIVMLYLNRGVAAATGRLLDRDAIYLANGKVIYGWIIKEDEGRILVELKEGSFSIPRSSCEKIEKDIFFKYIRAVR